AQHAGWAPTGAHRRYGLQHPIDDGIRGIEHHELRFVFRTAALRGNSYFDLVAWNQPRVHNRGGVVAGIAAAEFRRVDQRRAQLVVAVVVAAPHAFVDCVVERTGEPLPAHVHADLEEDVDDAGVLADRPLAFRAHA